MDSLFLCCDFKINAKHYKKNALHKIKDWAHWKALRWRGMAWHGQRGIGYGFTVYWQDDCIQRFSIKYVWKISVLVESNKVAACAFALLYLCYLVFVLLALASIWHAKYNSQSEDFHAFYIVFESIRAPFNSSKENFFQTKFRSHLINVWIGRSIFACAFLLRAFCCNFFSRCNSIVRLRHFFPFKMSSIPDEMERNERESHQMQRRKVFISKILLLNAFADALVRSCRVCSLFYFFFLFVPFWFRSLNSQCMYTRYWHRFSPFWRPLSLVLVGVELCASIHSGNRLFGALRLALSSSQQNLLLFHLSLFSSIRILYSAQSNPAHFVKR